MDLVVPGLSKLFKGMKGSNDLWRRRKLRAHQTGNVEVDVSNNGSRGAKEVTVGWAQEESLQVLVR